MSIVEPGRADLPISVNCSFRPWKYEISHRTLVLRGRAGEPDGAVDVVFLDVLAMKIRHGYERLLIAVLDQVEEVDAFAEIPQRHDSRYMRLAVSDGVHEGFVVCGSFYLRVGANFSRVIETPPG